MQELHCSDPKVGDMVLIDWPRTRWDHRQGVVREIKTEESSEPYGMVVLDGIAVGIRIGRLRPCNRSPGWAMTKGIG